MHTCVQVRMATFITLHECRLVHTPSQCSVNTWNVAWIFDLKFSLLCHHGKNFLLRFNFISSGSDFLKGFKFRCSVKVQYKICTYSKYLLTTYSILTIYVRTTYCLAKLDVHEPVHMGREHTHALSGTAVNTASKFVSEQKLTWKIIVALCGASLE